MANYRRGRINDETVRVMAELLRGVKDPRVSEAFISVTAAEVTPDLKYAKIYYSVLGGENDSEKMKGIAKGLRSASGYLRRGLAEKLNLRITPELTFVAAAGTSPNFPAADCVGFSVPVGQWHNTECLESGTVFIECKDGAYAPLGPEDVLG